MKIIEKIKSIDWMHAPRLFMVIFCVLFMLDVMFYMIGFGALTIVYYNYIVAITLVTSFLLTFILYDW